MTTAAYKAKFEGQYIPEPNSGCWLWLGVLHSRGYGEFFANNRVNYAHRMAWTFYRGEIPKGLHVLHRCDNPPCVNPDHLFLGTHIDNMLDMKRKGRASPPRGEESATAKLTSAQALAIRNDPRSHSALGHLFGVSPAQVGKIKSRKAWAHLPDTANPEPTNEAR